MDFNFGTSRQGRGYRGRGRGRGKRGAASGRGKGEKKEAKGDGKTTFQLAQHCTNDQYVELTRLYNAHVLCSEMIKCVDVDKLDELLLNENVTSCFSNRVTLFNAVEVFRRIKTIDIPKISELYAKKRAELLAGGKNGKEIKTFSTITGDIVHPKDVTTLSALLQSRSLFYRTYNLYEAITKCLNTRKVAGDATPPVVQAVFLASKHDNNGMFFVLLCVRPTPEQQEVVYILKDNETKEWNGDFVVTQVASITDLQKETMQMEMLRLYP